jgi:sugar/nucleoside kinase (ribokinase family)
MVATNRIFGFGSAAVDFRITTAEYGPEYRDKLLARETRPMGGGSVANCLAQVARLGGDAIWLGKLGTDWIGDRITRDLQSEGVGTDFVIRDADSCSPFNVAVYAEKRRVGGFLLPNSLSTLSGDEIQLLADEVAVNDFVIVEIGEIPLDLTAAFCNAVRDRGARVVVDVDLDPIRQCVGPTDAVEQILRLADLLVPNAAAMVSILPGKTPVELVKSVVETYERTTVVTAGADGVYWCEPNGCVRHCAAIPVAIVDTVGAGDAFHGGMVFGLATGMTLSEAIRLGVRCGAAACTAFGARTGMLQQSDLR